MTQFVERDGSEQLRRLLGLRRLQRAHQDRHDRNHGGSAVHPKTLSARGRPRGRGSCDQRAAVPVHSSGQGIPLQSEVICRSALFALFPLIPFAVNWSVAQQPVFGLQDTLPSTLKPMPIELVSCPVTEAPLPISMVPATESPH